MGILPGLIMMGLVGVSRWLGAWQYLEWRFLDLMMQTPRPESTDERIVLVPIQEVTIQRVGEYPFPDAELARLLSQIKQHEPRIIGLDIFRDLPLGSGHESLTQILATTPNLIGIEKAFEPKIPAPPALPEDRVGMADLFLDPDNHYRVTTLNAYGSDRFHSSFALRIAESYLATEGYPSANGLQDPRTIRFGSVEVPRVHSNFGGYVRSDFASGALQMLIYFRQGSGPGQPPFQVLPAEAILQGNYDPELLRDRIVLVGMATPSVPDYFSAASRSVIAPSANWIYGLELHAHVISQLISAVLDQRPLLRSWPELAEYLWIGLWGIGGIALAAKNQAPWCLVAKVCFLGGGLLGSSYLLFLNGWWIPVVPTLAVFLTNSLGLAIFYEHERRINALLAAKQQHIQDLKLTNEVLERRVAERTADLAAANAKLQQLTRIDPLTQVGNRRYFEEYLNQKWLELQWSQSNLGLIIIDIDYFKFYNDSYGHPQGDICLYQVAQSLVATLPDPDHRVMRYGGEEFVVVLPHLDLEQTIAVAEKCQARVQALHIPHTGSSVSEIVTLSMGAVSWIPSPALSPTVLLEAADQALYHAKRRGRCQVVAATANPIRIPDRKSFKT